MGGCLACIHTQSKVSTRDCCTHTPFRPTHPQDEEEEEEEEVPIYVPTTMAVE